MAQQLVELLNKLVIRSPKIQIQHTTLRGRGIFATSPLKQHEKIFTSLPVAFWSSSSLSSPTTSSPLSPERGSVTSSTSFPSTSSSSPLCTICYKSQLSCSDCQSQEELFTNLKKYHEMLLQNPLSSQSHFINLIGLLAYRICLELKLGYQNTFYLTHLFTFPILDKTKDGNNFMESSYSTSYQQLRNHLISLGYESQLQSFLDLDWYLKMIGVLNLNTIQIPSSQRINGVALYDSISFINHSCQPNVTLAFNGVEASVIALKELKTNEELFLDYVGNDSDLNSNDQKRYEYLHYNYGILCQGSESGCACGKYSGTAASEESPRSV
jgi:SET domain-containing protein